MKKLVPFAAAALLLAAFAAVMLIFAAVGKKEKASFDGASFVHLAEEDSYMPAAFFITKGGAV